MQSSIINHSGDCTNGRREKDVNHLLESRRHARNNAIGRGQKQQRRVRTGHSCVLLVAMANRSPVSFFPPSYNRTLSADNVLGDYVISLLWSLAAGMAKEKKNKKKHIAEIFNQPSKWSLPSSPYFLPSKEFYFFWPGFVTKDGRGVARETGTVGVGRQKKKGEINTYIFFFLLKEKKKKKKGKCADHLPHLWLVNGCNDGDLATGDSRFGPFRQRYVNRTIDRNRQTVR